MYITKSMLLNDVRDANAEFLYEGYQDVDDRNDAMADMQNAIMNADHLVDRKDYDSEDDYVDAKEDYWADGTAELCFVKRDSLLCTALMNFYSPNGTVKDFEKAAKNNISGFYSQMLPKSDDNEEGFWFVAGSDYLDALVPYKKQHIFLTSLNPSTKATVLGSLTKDESDDLTELLDEDIDDMKNHTGRYTNDGDYSVAIDDVKSARNKLGL